MKSWLSLNLSAILIVLLLICPFSSPSINADSSLSNDDVNSVNYYNDAAEYALFGEDDAPIKSIDSTEDETDFAAADSDEPDFDSLNGDLNEADIDSVVEVNSASQDNFGATGATGAGFAEKKPGFFKRWFARFRALFDWTRKSQKAQLQQQQQQQQQSSATQQTASSSTGVAAPSSSDASSADEQEQLDPDYIGAVYSHSIKDMETLQQDSTSGSSVDPAQPITSERRVYYPTRSNRGQRAHKIVNIYNNNHNHMRLHPRSPQYYTPQHYYGQHYTYPNYHLPHTSQYGFTDLSGNWHWNAAVYQRYMTFPFLNAAGKERRVSHYIRKYLRGTRADFIKHGLLNADDTVVGQQELREQHKVITPRDDDLVEIPVMIPIYEAAYKPTQQPQQQPQPAEQQVDASESTGVAQQVVDPKQQQVSGSPAAAQQEADEPVDEQPVDVAQQQATGADEQQTVTGAASLPAVQSQPQHPSADSGASGVAASSPAAVPTVPMTEQSASTSNAIDSVDEQSSPAGDAPAPAAPATSSTLAAAAGSAQTKAAAAASTPTALAQNDQAFDEPPDQAKSAQQKK